MKDALPTELQRSIRWSISIWSFSGEVLLVIQVGISSYFVQSSPNDLLDSRYGLGRLEGRTVGWQRVVAQKVKILLQLCDLFLLLSGEVSEVGQRLSGADDVLQVDNRFAFVRASGRG